MRVALHDSEMDYMPKKSFPNYALIKFAQRYVYSGKFRTTTWAEYLKKEN